MSYGVAAETWLSTKAYLGHNDSAFSRDSPMSGSWAPYKGTRPLQFSERKRVACRSWIIDWVISPTTTSREKSTLLPDRSCHGVMRNIKALAAN